MTEYIIDSADLSPYQRAECAKGEIIRCRDCEYLDRDAYGRPVKPWGCEGYWCELVTMDAEPDGYCAWGERREK